MNEPVLLTLTTCPDAETADRIAAALVAERLAACVNRIGPIGSVFRWHGQVARETEWLLLAKTTAATYPRLEQRIVALHPYEVPEVVAVQLAGGSSGYLAWLRAGVEVHPGGSC